LNKFPSNEYELIKRVQAILPPIDQHSPYEVTIGDDAAIRINNTPGERLIITADVSVENVHFSLDTMTFEEIGYRSMVSNLSDCAAMGAKPDGALIQLVFPKINKVNSINTVHDVHNVHNVHCLNPIEQIYAGFSKACNRWNFPIVGGDLSGGTVWTIGITLLGSIPPESKPLRRTGIAEGDALWVTGTPGESAAGLAALQHWGRANIPPQYNRLVKAHITPKPAIDEGTALAAAPSVHAMMDLSDGLSKDIATLCFDNNLGFIFDKDILTNIPSDMIDLSNNLNTDPQNWFYHGGEEYELLFACAPSFDPLSIDNIHKNKPNTIRLGHFTSKTKGVLIHGDNGMMEELKMNSWDHCC